MAEPLTLAVVATAVVTEGIKFLYDQAAEAIKRWRERRDAAPAVAASAPPPAVFGNTLQPLQIHLERVATLEPQLLSLRRALADVADGLQTLSPDDPLMLEAADALRQAMEVVYQQRLSFVGESRPASGPVVEGVISVNTVAGTAAAVEARLIQSGRISGHARAGSVEQGGSLHGVKADIIGGSRS